MGQITKSLDTLGALHDEYRGRVEIEIDPVLSVVRFDATRPTYVRLSMKVFLGLPVQLGGRLIHPVEMPVLVTFDSERDGNVAWSEVCQSLLRRGLDSAYPGASGLLDKDPMALLIADRMRLYLTGASEGPLRFEISEKRN